MAFTLDQLNTGTASGVAITPSAGAKLVIAVFATRKASNPGGAASVQFNGVNMTALTKQTLSTVTAQVFYTLNPTTGSSQQVTFTSADAVRCTVASFTVAAGKTAAYDTENGATGTGTGPSVSITPGNQPNVIIAICSHEGGAVMTGKGTGQVGLEAASGDGFIDEGVWNSAQTYEATTSTAANAQTFTNAASDTWAEAVGTFIEVTQKTDYTLTGSVANVTFGVGNHKRAVLYHHNTKNITLGAGAHRAIPPMGRVTERGDVVLSHKLLTTGRIVTTLTERGEVLAAQAAGTSYALAGTVKNVTFSGGTHTPKRGIRLVGAVKNITFSAGTNTAAYGKRVTGTVANVTFAAGSNTAKRGIRSVGAVANVTFTGGTHITRRGIKSAGTVANVTLGVGTHTAAYGRRRVGTVANVTFGVGNHKRSVVYHGTAANITFGAGTHTATYTPGAQQYSLTGTVKNITFGVGTHALRRGLRLPQTLQNVTFAGGTHTPRRGIKASGTVKNVTFAAGSHTGTYTGGTQHRLLTGVVKNITFAAGTHDIIYARRHTGTVANITFAGSTATKTHVHYRTHTVANITFTPGVHRVIGFRTSVTQNITFGVGTHTMTYSGAAQPYTLAGTVRDITFGQTYHTRTYMPGKTTRTETGRYAKTITEQGRVVRNNLTEEGEWVQPITDVTRYNVSGYPANISLAPGVHTKKLGLPHVTANITFTAGTHALLARLYRAATVVNITFGVGIHKSLPTRQPGVSETGEYVMAWGIGRASAVITETGRSIGNGLEDTGQYVNYPQPRGNVVYHTAANLTFTPGNHSRNRLSHHVTANITFTPGVASYGVLSPVVTEMGRWFQGDPGLDETGRRGTEVTEQGIFIRPRTWIAPVYHASSEVQNITFAGGTHQASRGYRLLQQVWGDYSDGYVGGTELSFHAGLHSGTPGQGRVHVTANITFAAGTHTTTTVRSMDHVTANVTFGAGTHFAYYNGSQGKGYQRWHTVANLPFQGGTQVPNYHRTARTHTVKNITLGAGTHTSRKARALSLVGACRNVSVAAGLHSYGRTQTRDHTVENINFHNGNHIQRYSSRGQVKRHPRMPESWKAGQAW